MLPDWELVVRLVVAAALGSFIGADRERLVWAAGLYIEAAAAAATILVILAGIKPIEENFQKSRRVFEIRRV